MAVEVCGFYNWTAIHDAGRGFSCVERQLAVQGDWGIELLPISGKISVVIQSVLINRMAVTFHS